MNGSLPSNRQCRFYQGPVATCVANSIQVTNFLADRFFRKRYSISSRIDELYKHSVNSAFSAKESFLVTGAPHASAYYPRDFAWFYPDVLDPGTIMDSQDAIRRIHLLERSVRLMLEAVRSGVITTTLIRQLLFIAFRHAFGNPRRSGANYMRGPKGITVLSGNVTSGSCWPLLACRV
jgi:hypothetical protein